MFYHITVVARSIWSHLKDSKIDYWVDGIADHGIIIHKFLDT